MQNNEPAHAEFSPSSSDKWIGCAGSMVMEEPFPNVSTAYADEGTAAHTMGELALKSDSKKASDFVGVTCDKTGIILDEEMAEGVQKYVDEVLGYLKFAGDDAELMIEGRVYFGTYLEQDSAFGTSDAAILAPSLNELQVHDLKFGQGVQVDAKENKQLMLYALGVMLNLQMKRPKVALKIKDIRLVIHQPRLGHLSEWSLPVKELWKFADKAKKAAARTRNAKEDIEKMFLADWQEEYLKPGDKTCLWCRAKGSCPAFSRWNLNMIAEGFENLDEVEEKLQTDIAALNGPRADRYMSSAELSRIMQLEDTIEKWQKAVRGEVESRLFQGEHVPGYKIVEGRMGDRQFEDADEARIAMRVMKLTDEEMYEKKLRSAPKMEKVLKKRPALWKSLEKLIVRQPGQPHVAPESDPRPALEMKPTIDSFEDIPDNE